MEFALPELLSRAEILTILQERQLKIDLETLSCDELLRIYKTFAVPLAKRENNSTRKSCANYERAQKRSSDLLTEADTTLCPEMVNAKLTLHIECSMQTQKVLPLGEKRAYPLEECPFDGNCSLSTTTKRIKINWR